MHQSFHSLSFIFIGFCVLLCLYCGCRLSHTLPTAYAYLHYGIYLSILRFTELAVYISHILNYQVRGDFPQGTSGKESTCQCRRHSRCGFDPWVRKIPMSTKWHLTPAFLPGKLCCSFEINVSNINIIHDKIYVFKADSREKCYFGMV